MNRWEMNVHLVVNQTSWADEPDIGRVRLWVFDIVELLSWAASWAGRIGCWAGEDAEDDERQEAFWGVSDEIEARRQQTQ